MKPVSTHRLTVVVSALLLSGTVAFAQVNMPHDSASAGRIAASVDTTDTARTILTTGFADREKLLVDLEARMSAVDSVLSGLSQADSAKKDLRNPAEALIESIKKSREASEADWPQVRSELSVRYSAYAEAAIRTEQAAATQAQ